MSMFPSGFGNQGVGDFYPHLIDQSLRFNDDDSAHLLRTPSVTGDRKTWTWSGWVKFGNLAGNDGGYLSLFATKYTSGLNATGFWFLNNELHFVEVHSGIQAHYLSTVKHRDPSSHQHVVVVVDTTDADSTDRVRFYVNGERITDVTVSVPYALSANTHVNRSGLEHLIAASDVNVIGGISREFDGYLSDIHFIDGQALDPTSFGEFKNGVWIPKAYEGAYGTNGFHLDFANSLDIGNDVSGNNNDWTPVNLAATDVVLDSPTNNWCTLNPIDPRTTGTLSDGNLVTTGNATVTNRPTSGQWYYEKDGVGVSYDADVSGQFDPVLTAGSYNFGQLPWADLGPTGTEQAINCPNLPEPVIGPNSETQASDHFNGVLYTGNGSVQSITGVGFQPEVLWGKGRSQATGHQIIDAVRGANKLLQSNNTNTETNEGASSLDVDGFTWTGSFGGQNASGQSYAAWCWKMGGAGVVNNDGTLQSTVSVNELAGQSIVSFVGNNIGTATVGTGLPSIDFIIEKSRDDATNWWVAHKSISGNLQLDTTSTLITSAGTNGKLKDIPSLIDGSLIEFVAGSSSVSNVNPSGSNCIAYCYHSVEGYSKFGKYMYFSYMLL